MCSIPSGRPTPPVHAVITGRRIPSYAACLSVWAAPKYALCVRKDPWDRASFERNTRPNRVDRDISRSDLFVPEGDSKIRLLAICLACGVMFSLLFVWTTLGLAATMGLNSARWLYAIVLTAAIVAALGLFVFASRDFRRWREWAEHA
jgi:hypothetical protein